MCIRGYRNNAMLEDNVQNHHIHSDFEANLHSSNLVDDKRYLNVIITNDDIYPKITHNLKVFLLICRDANNLLFYYSEKVFYI